MVYWVEEPYRCYKCYCIQVHRFISYRLYILGLNMFLDCCISGNSVTLIYAPIANKMHTVWFCDVSSERDVN